MMAWQDRDFARDGGGSGRFSRALRRVFGESENPLTWAVPLYRAWGIRVRVHIVLIVFILAELLWAISQRHIGLGYMAMAMAVLFMLILLHEYGHCLACRRVGGEASEILLWPLGGLAECHPPQTWRAHLITAAGGPMVNVLLAPVLAGAVLMATQDWRTVLFNLFDPSATLGLVQTTSGLQPIWLMALWWASYLNLVLLGLNVLIPMYPMDGGRLVQCVLWARVGEQRSMHIAVTVGLVAAVVLFVLAMVFDQTMLMALALFGGLICWLEKRRLTAINELGGGIDLSAAFDHPDRPASTEPSATTPKQARKQQTDQDELDRILAKIARDGMASLTRREKGFLQRTTRSQRTP